MHITHIRRGNKQKVYDLYVDSTHCFSVNSGVIVHNCDSLRYFCIFWISPAKEQTVKYVHYSPDRLEDYRNARSNAEREAIVKIMGGLPQ